MTATPAATPDAPADAPLVPGPRRVEPGRLTYDERAERTSELLERSADLPVGSPEQRAVLDEVVVVNMRVAQAVARRYRRRGLPLDDLTQIAYAALVRAVREFDPHQGRDLLAYAVPTMTGEIRRYFRDQGWVVRPPRQVQRAHGRLLRTGTVPDRLDDGMLERLAGELGESVTVLTEALRLRDSENVLSLEHSTAREPGDAAEPLSSRVADDDDRAVERIEAHLVLEPALAVLAPRERQVLAWRFVDEASQREIAERLQCSQVQVSRLLRRILGQLRACISDGADQHPSP